MLDFQLLAEEDFAVAQLEGLVTLDAWREVLQRLADEVKSNGAPSRLVIDIRRVLGYLGIPERKTVGALMAHHFLTCAKVAVVVQAQKITGVVSGEANRHGLDLRLFPDFDDAVAWIRT
ncbi:hypothetical protein [Ramlibacter sp. PS4R-6]|uniref:hypothetical protein n=1 Tax=Ramlibacter sp. PS4R-6 TaxID=3133438 RepID=UPI0030B3658F